MDTAANIETNDVASWLVECALAEHPIEDTILSFVEKLNNLGIPVQRFNCSTYQRHQIMGAIDHTWEEGNLDCDVVFIPKSQMAEPVNAVTPVGALARSGSSFERYRLDDPGQRASFPIFEKLHARGFTDYLLLKRPFGRNWDFQDFNASSEAVYGSLATRQEGGFSDEQIDSVKSLWTPFSLFLKSSTDRLLSAKLLEAYVGRLPAHNILEGLIERGDGNSIHCALWYSDLRGSTRLSRELAIEDYLEVLNQYFDCTAGAVMEHGGEVLKLIGDAVMAIFPYDDSYGAQARACLMAMSTAHQAIFKAAQLKTGGAFGTDADLSFGIGLHIGEVILGNVGTAQRLDMTVTGAAANQVAHLEALTKELGTPVLASPQFFKAHQEGLVPIGRHEVPDLGGSVKIFTLERRP